MQRNVWKWRGRHQSPHARACSKAAAMALASSHCHLPVLVPVKSFLERSCSWNSVENELCSLPPCIRPGDDGDYGGETGIRTLDRVSPIHAFQACAFNHSAISPVWEASPEDAKTQDITRYA